MGQVCRYLYPDAAVWTGGGLQQSCASPSARYARAMPRMISDPARGQSFLAQDDETDEQALERFRSRVPGMAWQATGRVEDHFEEKREIEKRAKRSSTNRWLTFGAVVLGLTLVGLILAMIGFSGDSDSGGAALLGLVGLVLAGGAVAAWLVVSFWVFILRPFLHLTD